MPTPRDLTIITLVWVAFRGTANFCGVFPKQTRPITSLLKQRAMFTCYASTALTGLSPNSQLWSSWSSSMRMPSQTALAFFGRTVTLALMVPVLRMRKKHCSMALCDPFPCYPRLGVTQDPARFGGRQHCTGHWAPMSLSWGHQFLQHFRVIRHWKILAKMVTTTHASSGGLNIDYARQGCKSSANGNAGFPS